LWKILPEGFGLRHAAAKTTAENGYGYAIQPELGHRGYTMEALRV
jgi:hypothetical protein